MSLHSQPLTAIPEDTARVAHVAFPNGNLYLLLRDELGCLFTDADFAALYPTRGQPAEAPWRLALVTIFQFLENLSDRRAADAVRGRIDWKYALGLDLADPGFDSTVLCEFRARLARWTFIVDKDGKVAYKNVKVTPADDSKRITEFIATAETK